MTPAGRAALYAMTRKDKVLELLTSSASSYLSGAQLARRFRVSRTAIWKYIRALEEEGYTIESVPSKGYRILAAPDAIRADRVRTGRGRGVIGSDLRVLPEVGSTNTLALELAHQGAPEGTVVVAERQTAGKGRLGRTWISPPGNLYLSVILRPAVPTAKAPLLTLMGAAAVCSALRKHLLLPAGIKWPNDILLEGRKAGGLLTEMSAEQDRIRHVVLGIGLNVNMDLALLPGEVRAHSTTLSAAAGARIDRTALLLQVLAELERTYLTFLQNDADVLREWEQLSVTLGRRVAVHAADGRFEGNAEGIDRDGRLVVRPATGAARAFAAGDVTILKS